MLEAVIEAAPGVLQSDLVDLFTALHRVSPTETAYFLRNVIANSPNRLTAATFRRILPSLPPQLAESIRGLVKPAQATR
jgi:hypothetical protein